MATVINKTTDQDIADRNKITQLQGDINAYYNDIKDNLVYKEIKTDYNALPNLVDVGCICNDEFSNFAFNTNLYWDADTLMPTLKNAEKMLNDLAWSEQSNLHNGSIQSSPGMVVLTKNANTYILDDTAFFNNELAAASGPSARFNTFGGTGGSSSNTAIDLFGYFHPDATGSWKFTIPASNVNSNVFTYLWVGDSALFDYTADNADINTKTTKTSDWNSKSFDFAKDDYIPFRIQFISKNAAYNGNSSIFSITPPSNSVMAGTNITTNPDAGSGNDWKYFVTFTSNGKVYYKNVLYFGVVANFGTQRANCFFVDANDAANNGANAQNIRKYKTYPKLQYVKVNVPTPAMSGKGQVIAYDGDRVKLTQVPGVNITINSAVYGLADDFPYDYITYKDGTKDVKVDATVDSRVINTPNQNLPTKPINFTVDSHTSSTPTKIEQRTPMKATQHIDVTAKLQSMIEQGYKLEIAAGQNNFMNLFGDPISETISPDIRNPNKNNPNVKKMLIINFTITVEDRLLTEKTLQLDSNTAKIIVQSTFNGIVISAPMTMNLTPPCSGNKCGNGYKMRLTDNAKLEVVDANGAPVGNIDLTVSAQDNAAQYKSTFNINDCLVNDGLKNDPTPVNTELNADAPISKTNGNKMKSPNNKFKLAFENSKLTFTYCVLPYIKESISATQKFGFTTSFHVSNTNNKQILYLYRIKTNVLIGRKFLNETSSKTGLTTLHYIPNTHNLILNQPRDASKFEQPFGAGTKAYPLMYGSDLAFKDNYNKNTDINSYTDCANQCLSDTKCEHFFFLKNGNAQKCYTDITADSNPTYTTTTSNPNISTSNFYKKSYTITSSCTNMKTGQPLYYPFAKDMPNTVTVDYRIPDNKPETAYYCSLDLFKTKNAEKTGKYIKGVPPGGINSVIQGFTTVREGMTPDAAPTPVDTSQFGQYAPDFMTTVVNKFPILNTLANYNSQLQDQVGAQYDQTIEKLRKYDNINTVVSSPQYKENTTDTLIPEQYINIPGPKPRTSLVDGMKKDVGIMLIQQNTMYTVASITAATFLILGVAFAGSGVGGD